ncbi:hypothetical protein FWH09_02980 [Candidatus Saccharibacteria bacterium]|nr:hypothetical protein [Candidatus Saccharibacteria bacterium]
MLLILFSWWYSDGLKRFYSLANQKILVIADFFSIGQLFATLFNPFRQISNINLRPDTPINVRFQAGLDKLISRFIGAFMRILIIIAGTFCLLLSLAFAVISVILYILTPFLPIIFIALFFIFGGIN